jgi:hypothetical protein
MASVLRREFVAPERGERGADVRLSRSRYERRRRAAPELQLPCARVVAATLGAGSWRVAMAALGGRAGTGRPHTAEELTSIAREMADRLGAFPSQRAFDRLRASDVPRYPAALRLFGGSWSAFAEAAGYKLVPLQPPRKS